MTLGVPEGTKDILPAQAEIANPEEKWRNSALWQRVEAVARDVFRRFGYDEIRTPIFEYTQLFYKSSGETTDIVEKEMFTFGDPAEPGGTFSLRPELTPGVVRALVEISGEDATCAEALSDASERLLRHVEIRRQTALSFPAAARLTRS